MCGPHEYGTVIDSHRVGYTSVDLSLTVILLVTQTQITHLVRVYYMIKLFNSLFFMHCIKFRILCLIRNIDLSLWYLSVSLKFMIESDVNFSTFAYPLTTCMVHRHIHSLILKQNMPWGKLLKGQKPCGEFPCLFQGRVNISK